MKVTKEGLDLIKKNEGCCLNAYIDAAGILTIGFGHTGDDVYLRSTITQERADELLAQDVHRIASAVEQYVAFPLNDNQFSALVSFTYNVGPGNFLHSGVLKHVNEGNFDLAMHSLLQWNKAGGKVLAGLTKRREEEKALFEKEMA